MVGLDQGPLSSIERLPYGSILLIYVRRDWFIDSLFFDLVEGSYSLLNSFELVEGESIRRILYD